VVQKLLLGRHTPTAQGLFHELLEVVVGWSGYLNLRLCKGIARGTLGLSLHLSQIREELASVGVTIADADAATVDLDVFTDTEILGHKWRHSIGFKNHVTLEEGSLGNT